mmetsp:Transcript_50114/g.74415  ORF Transcript_50114/g.74415 Transcript_50114/m.74415 type:complete len:361 (+) Transcript_50114:112-1194(+)|eukprot:CAMPEP_0195535488 /NCGR_PEP_ID=MMETSP0794_2-20130614/44356_1 /TAXON_ID=515487 /ORGANISM="Stephanopyxis turris, Strain CCMP 815" /LENGTH=360 /DNA_ID=CAMNT_0040668641 /DNA_START=98 /DNA_END=1180 /DNA_ORIENTATION=-
MEALASTTFGAPKKVLSFIQTSLPEPAGPTELRIRVCYVELNPVDIQKLGMKPDGTPVPSHRSPFIVGYGGSGIVEKVGDGATEAVQSLLGKRVSFLCDSNRDGAYATHVIVDYRLVSEVPSNVNLENAAALPLSGCTAFEALNKVGLTMRKKGDASGVTSAGKTLLIVGGAGGVGSWTTLLARAAYPDLDIVSTVSSPESKSWCEQIGASRTIDHDAVGTLGGGRDGSVDYIICLTEPTKSLFKSLAEVLKPFGKICLVVAGKGVESLDLSFIFFKCGTITTETVFSSSRSGFVLNQGEQIRIMLDMMARNELRSPLMTGWRDIPGTANWKDVLQDKGAMDLIASGHCRGKLIMKVTQE